jgi:aspartyl-tRNA(Asn)/glutamyl-tRNA(Gln) amidotransferase subunit B
MSISAPEAGQLRIGLEVHARLRTASKAFCRCANDANAAPNTCVCPVCMGLPGALPEANGRMIECALLAGIALDASVCDVVRFSRKLYSYPDLPKGYQITQFEHPLCTGGRLRFRDRDGAIHALQLWRLHVEEDAAKLTHTGNGVQADYNRCGAPLLEIVSAPDLRSADEAVAAARELRRLLFFVGVCDGKMEAGSFRCDVNVSVGNGLDTGRSEIKNLNSFAAIHDAVTWEGKRLRTAAPEQTAQYHTIHWDQDSRSGTIMRSKEREYEYRYSVEPDLPCTRITDEMLSRCRAELCELPLEREARLRQHCGLTPELAALLCTHRDAAEYFEESLAHLGAASPERAILTARWMTGELSSKLGSYGGNWYTFPIRPPALADLLLLIMTDRLSATAAKQVLAEMLTAGTPAEYTATRLGLLQISDERMLDRCILEVIGQHGEMVAAWRSGRTKVFTALMGEVMRTGSGRLNPQLTAQRLQAYLSGSNASSGNNGEGQ